MLSRADVERLLTAPSVQAGMRVLSDTEYASAIAAVGRSDDYERVLSAELQRVYDFVASFAPQEELLKMWAARFAFLGLKTLLKAGLQGQDVADALLPAWMPVERGRLRQTVERVLDDETEFADEDTTDMQGLETYLSQAAKAAVEAYQRHQAPEEIDHSVDMRFQQYLLDLTESREATFLRDWVVRFADVTNLTAFVRFAVAKRPAESLGRALLPGGSMSSERVLEAYAVSEEAQERVEALLQVLTNTPYASLLTQGWRAYQEEGLLYGMERMADGFLREYLDSARHQPFGIGVVWSYLMAKEREVRLIRLILAGKSAGMSERQLRERIEHV
jgi:V/A-type H+-transporting ATPase subunit C